MNKFLTPRYIIFYSILGIISLFIARGIRSQLDYPLLTEVLISSSIIIPMYIIARKVFKNFLQS
ncbi:MAG: hypothetical protein EBW94_04390 [Proteobacteria bacterium]|nr:hypothetical protein [Pseudomonadota bacterium]